MAWVLWALLLTSTASCFCMTLIIMRLQVDVAKEKIDGLCQKDALEFAVMNFEKRSLRIVRILDAASSIVEKIRQVGDIEDWVNGPETHINFYWHEIENLSKELDNVQG